MKRFPFLTAAFAGIALALHAAPALSSALEFERDALARGEVWRLFTGHLTHFGGDHLRWDLAVFLALGPWIELRSRRALALCLAGAALAISVGVWGFQPQFTSYRGLSGIDSALFGYVAADLIRRARLDRDWPTGAAGALALAGFVAKSAWELIARDAFFVAADGAFLPVPLAHVVGAVVGIASVVMSSAHGRRPSEPVGAGLPRDSDRTAGFQPASESAAAGWKPAVPAIHRAVNPLLHPIMPKPRAR